MEQQIIWKQVICDGVETFYSVSNTGLVRNDVRNKLLTQRDVDEYKYVTLAVNKKSKNKRVHRLVAEAFIPNPDNKPVVNHKDGVRYHNHVDNLEWCTYSENSQHACDNGLIGVQKTRAVRQYNLNGELMMTFESATEAARQCNLQQSKITDVCRGNRRMTGDYQWRYDDANIDKLPPVPRRINAKKSVAQYTKNGEYIATYSSYMEAARAVNGTSSAISRICSNTPGLHTHKGYVWKLVDEIVQEEIDE